MRRVLFTAFLTLTALSVLGGNFMQVVAPPVSGEVGELAARQNSRRVHRPFVPAEVSRLSAEPVAPLATSASPIEPADASAAEHAMTNDDGDFQPIEVREESTDVARISAAPEPLFVSTWTEIPTAAAHYLGLVEAPVTAVAERAVAERTPAAPDRDSRSSLALPYFVTAIAEVPRAMFSRRSMESLPEAPKAPAPAAFNSGDHGLAANTVVQIADDRTAVASAERENSPARSEIVASTGAPSADLGRQRIAAVPVYAAPEPAAGGHVALNDVKLSDDEHGTSAAIETNRASTMLPYFVAAVFEAPSSIFDRPRFAPEPKAPTTAAFLSEEHITPIDTVAVNADDRGVAVAADAPASSTSALPMFITAIAELPSAIFSPRSTEEAPKAPAPAAYVAEGHDTNTVAAGPVSTEDRGQVAAAEVASSSALPAFISAIAELPSNIIYGPRPAEMPAAPVFAAVAKADSAHASPITASAYTKAIDRDTAAVAERNSSVAAPVAITANTSMSMAMVTPMDRKVLVDAPLASESALAAAHNGDLTLQFDRAFAPSAAADKVAPAQPVLISGRPSFTMEMLQPMNAATANPFTKLSAQEELSAIQRRDGFCDPNWIGPPIRFSQTVELKLEDLINQLHQRFGVNFILGKGVANLPLNVKAGSIPWNVLLRSQLFVSGVRARCIDNNTVELIENANVASLQDMADVETRFVKLRFLQRTGSGTVDLANRSQGSNQGGQGGGCGGNNQGGISGGSTSGGGGGGGGQQQGQTVGQLTNNKYDKLIVEIEKILGLRSMTERGGGGGGDQGGGNQQQAPDIIRTNRFVTEIPGRNILAIRATKEEHALIDEFIRRADRPPFQVAIKGLVYTANQNRIRDIGVETTITGGTADGRTTGGVFGDTLGTGTLFDFSTVIGTFDFNVQATAFQENGIISVKSRPFATVIDGLCTTLDVGRQLPIVIDSSLGGQGDVVFVNAANNLAVTPYVLDDENGNPMAVTLELRLTANDIDSSVTARGVPAISARSIQTQLLLDENKTAILGGFTVDSDSRTDRKVPGLGDIPVIGELFRRRTRDARVNRLYFAISVDVITYPDPIRTVDVPGATTEPPSITPKQKKQADKMEPEQVVGPPPSKGP